jgi:hypothetical protein
MTETNIVEGEQVPDEIRQERGAGVGFNDVPGSGGMDASELVESLLSNEHIPEPLLKQMWVLFGKSTKLSFLKDNDIKMLMYQFELLRLTIIESIPKSAYDEDLELQLIQIRMEFELNLNRSRGGRLNERELLGSSTSATFNSQQMGHQSDNPGFLDKLTNMFR